MFTEMISAITAVFQTGTWRFGLLHKRKHLAIFAEILSA